MLQWSSLIDGPLGAGQGYSPDISVSLEDRSVYIAFHAGTAAQRNELLNEISKQAANEFRVELQFEEL